MHNAQIFLQGMTNKVGLHLHYKGGLQLVLSKTSELVALNTIFSVVVARWGT